MYMPNHSELPSTSSGRMSHGICEDNDPKSPGTPPYEDLIESQFRMDVESHHDQQACSATMPLALNPQPILTYSGKLFTPKSTSLPHSPHMAPHMPPFKKHNFLSHQRSPNVVKVKIFGNNIEGSELDSYFGQYGKITSNTRVLQGNPNYAYINYDTPLSATNACRQRSLVLKGTNLQLIPPNTSMTASCTVDHSHIECDELIAKYLKPKAEESMRKKSHLASVYIQISSNGGIDLWCQSGCVQEATQVVEEILKIIQDDMVREELKLDSLLLPSLMDTSTGDILSKLDEMQMKQSPFELTIRSQSDSEKTMPLREFSKMLHRLDDYIHVTTDSDVLTDFVTCSSEGTCNKWLWESNNHKFIPYPESTVDTLNKHFSDPSCTKQVKCEIKHQKYIIDLKSQTQTNVVSQRSRKIKRCTVLSPNKCMITLQLRTSKAAIKTIKTCVMEAFENSKKTICLPLPSNKDASKCLQDILRPLESKLFVKCAIIEEHSSSPTLLVRGIHTYLNNVALPEVKSVLLSLKQDMLQEQSQKALLHSIPQADFPNSWDDSEEMVTSIPILKTSQEWNEIESLLHSTLPRTELLKLERIQNKWLWSAYQQSKNRMSQKNGGEVKELRLFHGTSSTQPERIFKSEKGFDFRFSMNGMWGRGTYFAVKASYSNRYAYIPNSESTMTFHIDWPKQLIVAQVLTGQTVQLKPDNNLTKPPVIQKSMKASGLITVFEEQCYDSVTGFTGDSQIFVVYDHDKAYPEYLLTYTDSN